MTLIYVIAGLGILVGLASLMVFFYRAGRAKGIKKSSDECDKKILFIKSELSKKIYGSVNNLNEGLDIKNKNVIIKQ